MTAHDRGSGAVLVLAMAAVVLSAALGVLAWASAVTARQRAEGVADLAALAGARAQASGGNACAAAGRIGALSVARLARCSVGADGSVRVVVEVDLAWAAGLDAPPARARARAGVPP